MRLINKKEVELGTMQGPFDAILCAHYHVLPLMSRPKDRNDRQIIVDLSYGDELSVNGVTPRDVSDGCKI